MGSSVSGKMLEVAGDAEKVFMAGNGEDEKRRAHELIEKLAAQASLGSRRVA
jgi:hypothetical protein